MAAAARRLRDRGEANESAARGAYRLANQGSRVRVRRRDLCPSDVTDTQDIHIHRGELLF